MTKLNGWKQACAVFLFCAAMAVASPAQKFTTLVNFDETNGSHPWYESLIQGTDGNYYGTTEGGGTGVGGTVFQITRGGTLTPLYSFDGTDGQSPYAGLLQAANGNFYGTTYQGGANNAGTVFQITPGGTLTPLYNFCAKTNCSDGGYPYAGLVQATNGNLYGTTYGGGAYGNYGTVFEITPEGTLTTLHSFCAKAQCPDGALPYAGLVQATNGDLYGTTYGGGAYGDYGTVFKITTAGKLTTLHSFDYTDGWLPEGGLVQATNGSFYGTTSSGGPNENGTVFKITAAGKLTTLYSFCAQANCTDGTNPTAGLVQGTDGDFYGTTVEGGANNGNYGTIFKITPGGTLTTLHSFDGTDGEAPYGGLLQATSGTFYGTTEVSTTTGYGTVFSLSMGLGAFVETQPTSGAVGAPVIIRGDNLTGTTAVTFHGTAATFSVVSSSEITTTVPPGATTGTVEVTTPSGTLKSNVKFRVTP